MIFTPFDLSAAITLLFLSLSSSRLPIPSRGEREKEGEDERKEKKEGWAKMGEKGGKTARGQDDGLVYESPRNNGSPFYSWSTPLFEGSTWTWKGYHSTPEFPSQEKEGIFRRVCSRFIGRVNLSDRGAPGVANGEPTPRHPPLLKTTPLAPKYLAGDTAYRGLINEPKSSWLILWNRRG